jgi:hypothetical protein
MIESVLDAWVDNRLARQSGRGPRTKVIRRIGIPTPDLRVTRRSNNWAAVIIRALERSI